MIELVHGRSTYPTALQDLAYKRLQKDNQALEKTMEKARLPISTPLGLGERVLSWLGVTSIHASNNPDLYQPASDANRITGGDTADGDYARKRALICMHTLAFEHRERYYPFCKDAVLTSAYDTDLDLKYIDFWSTPPGKRMSIHAFANQVNAPASNNRKLGTHMKTDRICAYNNFTIRNWVRMLQDRDQRDDATLTDGEFDFEREEREAKAKQSKIEAESREKALHPTTAAESKERAAQLKANSDSASATQ
jgi:hypothetical protein